MGTSGPARALRFGSATLTVTTMYTLLITFFTLAIVFSFLCSLWEAVLLSITPAYAEIQKQHGSAIGRHLSTFKSNIDRPLAAILTLNTIAHTVGAIGVGGQAAAIWAETSPWVTKAIIPVAMTLAILILSEIIPKTIGATFWKELAPFTVRSLLVVIAALGPLVWLSQRVTRILKREAGDSVLSRSDFLAMTKIGERAGVFEKSESEIIKNLLRFEQVCAKDIMTPRTVVIAEPESRTVAEFYAAHDQLRFSRIPIFSDAKDHITGYVLKDELLSSLVQQEGDRTLGDFRRDIMVAKEDQPLPDLFSRLVEKREHIALVVDEFGGMAGIVTMEDVIETLLGLEIVDESDQVYDMQAHARAQWARRAKAHGLTETDAVGPTSS
ncbi:MAG TPA: hemolysin family protein [Pseudomonadales bacterium]